MGLLDDVSDAAGDAYDGWVSWNNPEELEGAVGQRDIGDDAEQILQDEYDWSEEDADDAVPDNTVEALTNSGEGLATGAGDAVDAAANFDPDDFIPDWMKFGVAGTLILAVLGLLAYAFGQLVTVNTEV